MSEQNLSAADLARNEQAAKHAGSAVKWKSTKISSTELARSSDPFREVAGDRQRPAEKLNGLSYGTFKSTLNSQVV